MIPRTDLVRRVIVVSEDILGPMQNTLYLDLSDGSSVCLDNKREIKKFIAELEVNRPQIATSIKNALATVQEHSTEQVFDMED